jgi:hypothetical protein
MEKLVGNFSEEIKGSFENYSKDAIIFDSGSLISIAMANLLGVLVELRKKFKGKFLITNEVKREIIDKPLKIHRFELQALMLNSLLEQGVLELSSDIGVDKKEVDDLSNDYLLKANNLFESGGVKVKIISQGEASCLALSRILEKKGYKCVIAIDERTTRVLVEKPENLQKLMSKKLNASIVVRKKYFPLEFKDFKIVRSTELMFVAYKKGLINLKGPGILNAVLWALKTKGCAITMEEIDELKKL